jgi:alkanesulfonate monooxygenase SsuD/methylene tetrahydromethanopterin reductase-like flavin-dependent oxidoreductase (luciferase family)
VDRFAEALEVITRLFADGPVDFTGEHYTITGLEGLPKPHTPGGPPVIVGGGGKRVLSIAARHADIVGINPNLASGAIGAEVVADAMAERVDEKVSWVRDAAGDRFDDLELNVLSFLSTVTDDPAGLAGGVAEMFGASAEEVLATPSVVVGTVAGICDTLIERRNRWGFSYYVFQADSAVTMAPVVAALAGT